MGLVDAGYFIDIPNFAGEYAYRASFQGAQPMWNPAPGPNDLNAGCLLTMPPASLWKCYFAQYFYVYIVTPIFATNSLYDEWQLNNVLDLGCSFNASSPGTCNSTQIKAVEDFRKDMLTALAPVMASKTNGYFFDTCVVHTETCGPSWYGFLAVPENVSMAETFGNWVFQRAGLSQIVDTAANVWSGTGGNPTCVTVSPGGWC